MSRWTSRLRRAAVALMGIHLLQVILLAAGAACDPATAQGTAHHLLPTVAPAAAVLSSSDAGQPAAHAHHDAAHDAAGHHAHTASGTPTSQVAVPSEHGHDHGPQHTTCPMAMACAATAVMTHVPSWPVQVITLASRVVTYETGAPDAARPAPEPPPPRA